MKLQSTNKKKLTGTKEWACKTVNIQYGCENNCKYCYARKMAQRFGRIPAEGWDKPIIKNLKDMGVWPRKTKVMFPSTHDITMNNIQYIEVSIGILLNRWNGILIVSKPRLECIKELIRFITNNFNNMKDAIEFRFTIGSCDDNILRYWEPNAPLYDERINCVKETVEHGFTTSISCEPLLEDIHIDHIQLIEALLLLNGTYPLKEIWIGAMNYTKNATVLNYPAIYECYNGNPKIKWKDSFLKRMKGI